MRVVWRSRETAICLQVTVGYREADSWWECFVEPVVCEDRTAEHDLLWQLVKDARAILQPCAETELASVFRPLELRALLPLPHFRGHRVSPVRTIDEVNMFVPSIPHIARHHRLATHEEAVGE